MANALRKYRIEKHLTFEELSACLGVEKTTLWRWEKRHPPAERVIEIERLIGIPRYDLRPDLYPREAA